MQFLTVIPLKLKNISEKKIADAMIFFPVVGLILGLFLSGLYKLLVIFNFPSFVSSVILVVALIVITGGMHLDGLSDTADAFFSGKRKEKMLAIMRDPHAGVMGILSLICIIFIKVSLLLCIEAPLIAASLILMCVLSRWSAVLAIFLFPYARRDGKAKVFFNGINSKIFLISTSIVFICVFFTWQINAMGLLLTAAGVTYLTGKLSMRKINGITGDILGAIIELTEIAVLFIVLLI